MTISTAFLVILVIQIPVNAAIEEATCPKFCTCLYTNNKQYVANCSHAHLESIPSNISSFKHLEIILLDYNFISTVEDGIFNGLTNLKHLDLSHNRLILLGKQSFVGIPNLQSLKLNYNRLVYTKNIFTENTFQYVDKVENLELYGNNLDVSDPKLQYPDQIMQYIPNLSTLKLDGLQHTDFGLGFASLKYLKKIVLSGNNGNCDVLTVNVSMFTNCPYLEKIDLSSCGITTVDAGAFSYLLNLTDLDISINPYMGLAGLKNTLQGINKTNLKRLNLHNVQHNEIVIIGYNIIVHLSKTPLEYLNLNENNIQEFERKAMSVLPKTLKYFSLRDNRITDSNFLKDLYILKNLETFDISFQMQNHISVPLNISGENQLNINDSPIMLPERVKYAFGSNLKLNYPFVPPLTFSENTLQVLDLSSNGLQFFGGKWAGLHSLRFFNLSYNKFNYIHPDSFTDMYNLTVLLLNNNNIGRTIQKDKQYMTFASQINLEVLDLSQNEIYSLPKFIFSNLKNLNSLILKKNFLSTIQFHLEGLDHLLEIDLQDNQISDIKSSQRHMLTELFQKNGLTLNLDMNSLKCDCDNIDTLKWMVQFSRHFINIQQYNCTFQNGSTLSISRGSELITILSDTCQSLQYTIFCAVGFTLLMFILSIIAIVHYKKWEIRNIVNFFSRHVNPYQQVGDEERHYNVFLSYSDSTSDIASKVEDHFEIKGISCFGRHKINYGEVEKPELTSGFENSDCIVVLLAKDYFTDENCVQEFRYGIHKGLNDGRQILITILLEDIGYNESEAMENDIVRYLMKNNPYVPSSGDDMLSYLEREITNFVDKSQNNQT